MIEKCANEAKSLILNFVRMKCKMWKMREMIEPSNNLQCRNRATALKWRMSEGAPID